MNKSDLSSFVYVFNKKTKCHTIMKLTPLEGEPKLAAKTASLDMALKWWLNRRKSTESAHRGFLWTSSENVVDWWSQILWNGTETHKMLSWVHSPLFCHGSSCAIVAIVGVSFISVSLRFCYRSI
jgi:hypothetical protein